MYLFYGIASTPTPAHILVLIRLLEYTISHWVEQIHL